jgi:hypothetical protein
MNGEVQTLKKTACLLTLLTQVLTRPIFQGNNISIATYLNLSSQARVMTEAGRGVALWLWEFNG